ncbi:MAG: type II toxin-antitoxin system RelE/ParE family toxin [Gemmataceae bacterium]|nr:type II toxin-antitoxin system RelE/ParE family toxin [Gemmataceae bacterium]MCI0742386.1 type II toxin-antitoxin system RelE/ParE family toxin [Gemmataceae bacterium]
MNPSKILFARSARKDLEALPAQTQERILDAIETLEQDPRPSGCKKLKGTKNTFRIRVGDYRVIYEIQDDEIVVFIVRIRHRKDAYK